MINRLLTITLIISALLFGSVEVWSSAAVEFMVFTIGLIWILKGEYRAYKAQQTLRLLLVSVFAFIAYSAFQMVPLPSGLVRLIASHTFEVKSFYSLSPAQTMNLSLNAYGTLYETIRCFAFLTVFAVCGLSFSNRRKLTEALKTLTIFGFGLAIFAVVQKATWNNGIYWFRELNQGGSPFGPFVNRNHYAGFMGMLVPLGLGLSITRQEKEKKILFGFMTVIMAVSLVLSLSRGGIVSFFAGMGLFGLLMLQRNRGQRKVWAIGAFIVIVLSYVIYLGIDPVIERFYKTDVTSEQRLVVWSATWNAIRDFWLTGSGPGTFVNVFPLYSPPVGSGIYDHAHNDYLEFLLESGLPGALLLLSFAAIMIYAVSRASFKGRKGILLAAAVASGFTMAVHSLFDFNLHILSNLLMFACVLGIVAALGGTRENDEKDNLQDIELPEITEDSDVNIFLPPEGERRHYIRRQRPSGDYLEGTERRSGERRGARSVPGGRTLENDKRDNLQNVELPGITEDSDVEHFLPPEGERRHYMRRQRSSGDHYDGPERRSGERRGAVSTPRGGEQSE